MDQQTSIIRTILRIIRFPTTVSEERFRAKCWDLRENQVGESVVHVFRDFVFTNTHAEQMGEALRGNTNVTRPFAFSSSSFASQRTQRHTALHLG